MGGNYTLRLNYHTFKLEFTTCNTKNLTTPLQTLVLLKLEKILITKHLT